MAGTDPESLSAKVSGSPGKSLPKLSEPKVQLAIRLHLGLIQIRALVSEAENVAADRPSRSVLTTAACLAA